MGSHKRLASGFALIELKPCNSSASSFSTRQPPVLASSVGVLRRFMMALAMLTALSGLVACGTTTAGRPALQPTPVRIESEAGRSQLLVGGRPLYIQGAGMDSAGAQALAAAGANAVRTWSTESAQEMLDHAWANGLYVAMGLEVARERRGFDYNDAQAVQRQLLAVQAEVLKYKDHPALILWIIGNELNLDSRNPKVWDAVNGISKMIHTLDPHHPTMTALAGISQESLQQISTRAADLDLLGFQMYADIVNLPRYLKAYGWQRPYLVTEWGATGHWEVAATAWGAPIEDDSTTKANLYRQRYATAIQPDTQQCLGSFVFLWGQKQERTPTWYGMFLESGEKTAAADVMHTIWKGAPPANQSPRVQSATLDDKIATQNIRLQAGQQVMAKLIADDPDHDALRYAWEVTEESRDLKTGGDKEARPPALPGLIHYPLRAEITLTAPSKPGAYRLFGYAYDGKGAAAHVNLPFWVDR